MTPWPNYHTHTILSDGKDSAEKFIKEAIKQGLPAIGFSDHAPMPYPNDWSLTSNNIYDYILLINELKQIFKYDIEIYLGMEIDYVPQIISNKNFLKFNLDYTIGSIHFVDKFNNGNLWGLDISQENFELGLKQIFKNDIQKAVIKYYEIMIDMLEKDPPDILGHFDLIKKFNKNEKFFSENELWYKNIVYKVLDTLKKTNVIMEINTRSKTRNLSNEFYPSYWILEEAYKRNIKIVLNADAHKIQEINNYFDEVFHNIKKIGFTEVYIFNNHLKWIPRSIS